MAVQAKHSSGASLATLDDWDFRKQVRGLVFDTTASNSGLKKGACALIKRSIGQDLAWAACCHHIMELILASSFSTLFGASGRPDVALSSGFDNHILTS